VVKDIEGVGGSEGSDHGREIRLAAIKGIGGYTRGCGRTDASCLVSSTGGCGWRGKVAEEGQGYRGRKQGADGTTLWKQWSRGPRIGEREAKGM